MRIHGRLAIASVSLLAIAVPAFAQDTAAKDSDEFSYDTGEIVVSARRRDESVQEVPLVVQAVTAQELSKLNVREFKDIQSLVPGLSMQQSANGIQPATTLRGMAFDITASGNNGTVEFYLNDSPLSSGILFQSMFDVGQIEVLRGPQGTLRGRASPSGSITVTTRKPDMSEVGGYVAGTVNDIGGWNLNGAINVPIIADKLAIRVAGLVDENEVNRVHSVNNPLSPSMKNRGIRASVQFQPFEPLTLFFAYTNTNRDVVMFDQDESLPGAPVTIRPGDRRSIEVAERVWDQTFTVYNWQAELRLFGQKLNYVGSKNKQRYNSQERGDRGGVFVGYPQAIQYAALHSAVHAGQVNHEIRLSSEERVAGMFDYVVGFLHDKLNAPTDLVNDTPFFAGFAPSPAFPFVPYNPLAFPPSFGNATVLPTLIFRGAGQTERSFFGNVTAHIGENTELSGGVRKIRFNTHSSLCFNANLGQPGAACPPASNGPEIKYSATIWSASAKHRFNDNLMVYANFGTSWRASGNTNPTLTRNYTVMPTAVAALLYPPPEKSKSYEIGFKSDWLDNRLRVNVTAYHQTFANFQYFARRVFFAGQAYSQASQSLIPYVDPNPTGLGLGVPAKVDGLEGEISLEATKRWNIGAVLSYARSKIKNGHAPCNDFYLPNGAVGSDGIPDNNSKLPVYADIMAATGGTGVAFCNVNTRAGTNSPFSATLQSEYTLPVGSKMDGYVRGLMTYYGKSQNDPVNAVDDISAYALVNLFAGVRDPDGGWEVGAYVKNLFDTERVVNRTSTTMSAGYATYLGGGNASTLYREISMTAPREIGVTARFSFGSH